MKTLLWTIAAAILIYQFGFDSAVAIELLP